MRNKTGFPFLLSIDKILVLTQIYMCVSCYLMYFLQCCGAIMLETFALTLSSLECKDVENYLKVPEISLNLSMNTPTQ